jgi:hypothetical protein
MGDNGDMTEQNGNGLALVEPETPPLTQIAQDMLGEGLALREPGFNSKQEWCESRSANGLYYWRVVHTIPGTPEFAKARANGFGGAAAGALGGRPRQHLTKQEKEELWKSIVADRMAEVLDELIGIAKNADNDAVKLQALTQILDREFGKPNQPITGADGGPIQVEDVSHLNLGQLQAEIDKLTEQTKTLNPPEEIIDVEAVEG